MGTFKIVSRETLKESVNAVAPKLPETAVFVAGARQIKNGQVEFEFAQSRSLMGRRASVLALLNEGDGRFNSGRTTMRVWLMANPEGFKSTFGELFDVEEVFKLCTTLKDNERVAVLKQANTINVNGTNYPVKIVAKETIEVDKLPKAIRELIQDPTANDEYKNRYILQTKDGDLICDAFGNKVYRHYTLSYGDDQDVLVQDKMLLSDFLKKPSKEVTDDVLASASKDLAS